MLIMVVGYVDYLTVFTKIYCPKKDNTQSLTKHIINKINNSIGYFYISIRAFGIAEHNHIINDQSTYIIFKLLYTCVALGGLPRAGFVPLHLPSCYWNKCKGTKPARGKPPSATHVYKMNNYNM